MGSREQVVGLEEDSNMVTGDSKKEEEARVEGAPVGLGRRMLRVRMGHKKSQNSCLSAGSLSHSDGAKQGHAKASSLQCMMGRHFALLPHNPVGSLALAFHY